MYVLHVCGFGLYWWIEVVCGFKLLVSLDCIFNYGSSWGLILFVSLTFWKWTSKLMLGLKFNI